MVTYWHPGSNSCLYRLREMQSSWYLSPHNQLLMQISRDTLLLYITSTLHVSPTETYPQIACFYWNVFLYYPPNKLSSILFWLRYLKQMVHTAEIKKFHVGYLSVSVSSYICVPAGLICLKVSEEVVKFGCLVSQLCRPITVSPEHQQHYGGLVL